MKDGRTADTVAGLPVAIGLGANLGNPRAAIRQAVGLLVQRGLRGLRASGLYESEPVDCVAGTPVFLNAALTGIWAGGAEALLILCQAIERQLGRPAAHSSREARVIDVDILLFGGSVVQQPRLIVPHPRLRDRLFVLLPLAEIAGDWLVPPGNETVARLCQRLAAQPELSGTVRWVAPGPGSAQA